jgi:solute carrier family 25 (mitochondrial phosphate transporter), member 23/24/25/41
MDSAVANGGNNCCNSKKFRLNELEKNMIAGGVAGCIAKSATAPLSRLTVLSQVSTMFPQGTQSGAFVHKETVVGQLRKIIKHQGLLSLWNGNFTSVIHRFPYSAINFAVFEAMNNHFSIATGNHDAPLNRFFAGATSGAAACFACYPLDLIRTRLTVANSFGTDKAHENYRAGSKIYNLVKHILQTEGIAGLYRGMPVSLFVTAPNLAISFSVYGQIKSKLLETGGIFVYNRPEVLYTECEAKNNAKPGVPHLSAVGSLLSGCLSGIAVVRKRMQVMGQLLETGTCVNASCASAACAAGGSAEVVLAPLTHHSSSIDHARRIFLTDGIRGFYRGLAPELMKVCPMVAIMYCSYEIVQDALNDAYPSPSKYQS